jgi:uncharacterized protein
VPVSGDTPERPVPLVAPPGHLVRTAGALARDHALRGCDAVHCAAALRVTSATTVALAGDRDLLAAWQREGLQILDTRS